MAGPVQTDLRVTVRVLNYAEVPSVVLNRAEADATWVYQQAGVATEWVDCSFTSGQTPRAHSCEAPLRRTEFVIKVLPSEMMRHFHRRRAALGFAALPDSPDPEKLATDAFVCATCVEELALAKGRELERDSFYAAILGSVMAHELGHLLIGIEGHSAAGIMHMPWDLEEFTMLLQHRLLFTRGEERKIQAQVRSRMSEERGMQRRRTLSIPQIFNSVGNAQSGFVK
jgi:hypothetical protein